MDEKHNRACAAICVCAVCVLVVAPPRVSVCILTMCVLTDVVSNVETCRRWSGERACRIIAATVTGRAASVKSSLSGEAVCVCVCGCVCVRLCASASLSIPPISVSPVGSLQTVADFQMFSSCITPTFRGRN